MFVVNLRKCLQIFPKVYVSSDSEWILEIAEAEGAIGILRSEELCSDVPNIPVYQHALQFMDTESIVAVQANSPTLNRNIIGLTKKLMEWGVDEVMTCHKGGVIYGSVWAIRTGKLKNYGDPYKPTPSVLIKDLSVDVHTLEDFDIALAEYKKQNNG